MVDLLARFRQIGEGRMLLRVGKVERPGAGGDRADEALAEAQQRQVDGAGVQAFGGVELEHAVGAQHIERAHLGHHVRGDLAHDPVEPLLRLERLGHELAEPFQQNARAGGLVTHQRLSCMASERVSPHSSTRSDARTSPGTILLSSTAYPARRPNAKSGPPVRCTARRSGSRS